MQDLPTPELDEPKRERRAPVWPLDVMFLAGLVTLGVGCAAYDWRYGSIAVGAVLLVGAAVGGRRL